jgi:membrane-bound lytic murein transglycosylase D
LFSCAGKYNKQVSLNNVKPEIVKSQSVTQNRVVKRTQPIKVSKTKLNNDIVKEFKINNKKEIEREALQINTKIFIQQPIKAIINAKVKKFIKLYSYNNGRWLYTAFKNGHQWLPYMKDIFRQYGLPEDLVYLSLIESHFNPNAVSKAGAVGLWQFMRRTAIKYGLKVNWWIDERRDPIKSTEAAAKYLKDLYNMFGSYSLAMAAYNAGEYRIKKLISRSKKKTFWHIAKKRRGLKKETKAYVPNYYAVLYLIRNNDTLKYIPNEWLNYNKKDFTFVQISKPFSLFKFAKEAGVSVKTLKTLNPELRRFSTPPLYENYILKIPRDLEKKAIIIAKNINQNYRFTFKQYRIKRGDTLIRIAKRYGIYPYSILKKFNNIKNVRALRPGHIILLPYPEEYSIKYAKRNKHKNYRHSLKKNHRVLKYKVRKGDNLWKVARMFNISIYKIKKYNNLRNKTIYPGDILLIKRR